MPNLDRRLIPHHEPEIVRLKGRSYAALCNKIAQKPYSNKQVDLALERAQRAYGACDLPYRAGPNALEHYPPDRFTRIYDETSDVKECVKVHDKNTGRTTVWPYWFGGRPRFLDD